MGTIEATEKVSNIIFLWISIAGIVVASIVGYKEYRSYVSNRAIDNSLKHIELFNAKYTMDINKELSRAWNKGYPLLIKALKGRDKQEIANRYSNYVLALIKEGGLEFPLDYIMVFYERVATCVNTKLCDKDTADIFFKKRGMVFFQKYYPYVCNLRAKWNDPAVGTILEGYFNPSSVGKICR